MIHFIRALALRTWDLIVSFGAAPYSYDAKGDFTTRDIYPTTYSLKEAIQLTEMAVLRPLRQYRRTTKPVRFKTVAINRQEYLIMYAKGRPDYPTEISNRLFK
jgi:hypothetical protein